MKNAPVAMMFYDHLAGLTDAQVIVLENADPPAEVDASAWIQVFTGRLDDGRYGLFPPAAEVGTATL